MGEQAMSAQEMYYGFSKEQQKEYEQYLVDKMGNQAQDLITESHRNTKSWKKEDWEKMKKESDHLYKSFAKAIQNNLKTHSAEVQQLVRQHFEGIQKFYQPTKEVYIGLGQLYLEHPDFRKFFDAYHSDLAQFLAKAMKIFAEHELS
jgi:hypothetical protein